MTVPLASEPPLDPPPKLRFPPALMAAEISRLQPLLPAWIRAVRPTLRGWRLELVGPGRTHAELLISLLPGALGLVVRDAEIDGPLPPESCVAPPPAAQQFLIGLEGWRLEKAFAPPREPVAVFGLSAPPPKAVAADGGASAPPPAGPWRTLVWELFGAAGNAVLLSLEDEPDLEDHWLAGRVLRRIHAAHGVSRNLEVGESYRLPRVVEHEQDAGAQPPMAHADWIDHLTLHWQTMAVEQLCRPFETEITRLTKKIGALRAQGADEATIARTLLEGQYLQAHPHRGKRGLEQLDPAADAVVWNLTAPIQLKPRLTVAENAAERFDQAHRWRKATEYAAEHLPPLEQQLAAARVRLRELQAPAAADLTWPDFVAEFLSATAPVSPAGPRGKPEASAPAAKSTVPSFVRRFKSSDDFLIDVGKSARDNHQLTFKSANGNDLLLHISGVPGAHVIIRCKDRPPKGSDPQYPPATVMEAARLCLHYSSRKAEGGEVVLAFVKDCRAGSKPGQVMIARPKYIRVKADPAQLQKLLDRKVTQ